MKIQPKNYPTVMGWLGADSHTFLALSPRDERGGGLAGEAEKNGAILLPKCAGRGGGEDDDRDHEEPTIMWKGLRFQLLTSLGRNAAKRGPLSETSSLFSYYVLLLCI